MGEPIAEVGYLAGLCGHDGTDWLKALIDAAGHLQVDLVASGGADLGDLETLLTEIQARLGDETSPAAGTVNKQLADLLTELEAKLETADLTSATTRYINTLLHQYTGSAWKKSNMLWGYHDNWIEGTYEQATADGTWAWEATEVPSGEVWVANCCLGVNYTRNPTNVRFYVKRNSSYYYLDWKASPGLGVPFSWGGAVVLKEGDILRIDIGGCIEDDWLAANVIGYKMDINM